jgi:hypothetical protein
MVIVGFETVSGLNKASLDIAVVFFKVFIYFYFFDGRRYAYMIISHMNTYVYSISINIFERLSRLDLEIHKVSHQEYIAVDRDVVSH